MARFANRRLSALVAVLLQVLLAQLLALPARAHESLPIVFSLTQLSSTGYSLSAQYPPTWPQGALPQVGVTAPCTVTAAKGTLLHIGCPADMAPGRLTLAYQGYTGSSPILLRSSYISGQRNTVVASSGATELQLHGQQTPLGIFTGYVSAGVHHILIGFDHLLFLICLLLIARAPRSIVMTVTGFTLGHALTISLATLNLLVLDSGVVEVLIALSIVFVAAEIARGQSNSLMWRRPWQVATLFGLLHGLGFAGALREIGLPEHELPLSLLAFNLGIEAGQLLFVLAMVLLAWGVRRAADKLSAGIPAGVTSGRWLSWPIGVIASVWFVGRLLSL
ncbi:HupE/UreJ family protein [Pseudomaricurvus sp. HS19]|uniref:HupE/UreJ family protein n=1 Tax=Pseudomaricurvus sp. HS19 TaxID=2692626 RepID=UPI00136CABA9|nr:HupE/UreJ family protein [Pseudomaricurvus sp. HS19]MYM63427.1 hypothetical protein [Pseudomaricurvus sp. HS19]